MIYCVWYPSGGFGHFINGILTLYGNGFKRPTNKIEFSRDGNSHNLELVAPKYQGGTEYNYKFDTNYNYSILVDLGVNSTDRNFIQVFSSAKIIKMCYTDTSWPVVAQTMINKAMKSTIESELAVDPELWSTDELWAQREKYFLFLREHNLRQAWAPEGGVDCILIESLLDYSKLKDTIEQAGIELAEFKELWNEWLAHNEKYFMPVITAKEVINKIKQQKNIDLANITDIWTQAVIYYFIWLNFKQEVPHNDFQNFFKDTDQIRTWLNQ